MEAAELEPVVEALLFASPDPLTAPGLARILSSRAETPDDDAHLEPAEAPPSATPSRVEAAIAALNAAYEAGGHAFRIVEGPGGWRFRTHPAYAPWIRLLLPEARPPKLTVAALETLAIIAYRQPIIKPDIEAIRGVSVDGVIQKLVERGLVQVTGRATLPGRPALYATTRQFLEHFGLKDIGELPNATELRRVPPPQPP